MRMTRKEKKTSRIIKSLPGKVRVFHCNSSRLPNAMAHPAAIHSRIAVIVAPGRRNAQSKVGSINSSRADTKRRVAMSRLNMPYCPLFQVPAKVGRRVGRKSL
jgi:hypothetical protein